MDLSNPAQMGGSQPEFLRYDHESGLLKVSLPFHALSVNSMWRTVLKGGRPVVIVSEKGRAFRKMIDEILRPSQAFYDFPIGVSIDAWYSSRRAFDCDNVIKPILDCLQHSGVIEDDTWVYTLIVNKHDYDEQKPDGAVWIDIWPI